VTKAATRSIGTQLRIGLNGISDLSSISSPSMTTEEIDVTTLDSQGGFREFIAGFSDPGEVSISGFFVPGNPGQAALMTAFMNKTIEEFEILYPPELGVSWAFDAYVSAFQVTSETESAIGFEATLRVTGYSAPAMSPSAGLSALVVTGTGGSLSPSFSNGVYYYTFDGVTATSITVTATAANHHLSLYVDGAKHEELESGVASSAITLTKDVGKKLTILAREAGKATVMYEIVAVKTA
jgi:predicted secreted protein